MVGRLVALGGAADDSGVVAGSSDQRQGVLMVSGMVGGSSLELPDDA